MLTVVSYPSVALYRQLKDRRFQRRGLKHTAAPMGSELLTAVRDERPQLVLLDAADAAAFELCIQIKREFPDSSVLLVFASSLDRKDIANLAKASADGVLFEEAPAGDLYEQAARLIGMSYRRTPRFEARLNAEIRAGERTAQAKVRDVSRLGAGLLLDQELPIERGSSVRLRFNRTTDEAAIELLARVAWRQQDKERGGWLVGAEFSTDDRMALARLSEMILWEIAHNDGPRPIVYVRGEVNELSDFARLTGRLPRTFDFDLSGILRLNSAGIRSWIDFLRAMPSDVSYQMVRCSVAFIVQAAMMPGMRGRGAIGSFFAPYRCEDCDRESERLFQSATFGGSMRAMPQFGCQCGGTLVFDDLEERFLSFLDG
jgi:PilZ domain-containing protein